MKSRVPFVFQTRGKKTPWFSSELRKQKTECNKAWNRRNTDFEAFRSKRKAFKKACRKAKKQSWRNFCESVEGCSATARIHKILAKDRKDQVCSLKLPNGDYTSDEHSLLNHLLMTHFPNSTGNINSFDEIEGNEREISSVPNTIYDKAVSITSTENIRWALNSFSPYKSPGPDGVFPALLQEGVNQIIESLHVIFTACLTLGFIPSKWRNVKVTFIPKPGRNDYEEAKNHRGISLSSFLLKTLERLVDRYIKEVVLIRKPLHLNQHAYQRGKSTMSAIHKLSKHIESALHCNEHVLAVFADIEGAFDKASFESFADAAKSHDMEPFIIEWILCMLQKRTLITEIKGIKVCRRPIMGCPQGGVLSPLIWLLIADSLLVKLDEAKTFSLGFADDFSICVRGKFLPTIFDRMQSALRILESYSISVGLTVNPAKVGAMLFTKSRTPQLKTLHLFGELIPFVNEFKYLGLTYDCKHNWNSQVNTRTRKACMTLGQCRRAIGRTWGLSPKCAHWLYTMIVRPTLTYGAVVWWKKAKQKSVIVRLNHLQRLGLLGITGAMHTTPTAALESLCGLKPLHIVIEEEARSELSRLRVWGHFDPNTIVNDGHDSLWNDMLRNNPLWSAPQDAMTPIILTDRLFKVLFPARDEWVERIHLQAEDYTFYTDGSLCDGLAGSGVYSNNPELHLEISLGCHATVFQAEVLAVTECARYCLQENFLHKKISLCSDSQAALKALMSYKIDSRLVLECRNLLQELSQRNLLTLVWVPGHSDISGNEEADGLARGGSSVVPTMPAPCIPLSKGWMKSTIRLWGTQAHSRYWKTLTTCKQTKLLIKEPLSRNEAKRLISMKRTDLRKLVGVVTGHFFFNKHLKNMRIKLSSLCERCEGDEDTAYHLICLCPRYANRRFKILGDYVLSLKQYERLSIKGINDFISTISLEPEN